MHVCKMYKYVINVKNKISYKYLNISFNPNNRALIT